MRQITLTIFAFLTIFTFVNAQENNWLSKNFHTVSGDANQQNFSDLQFLKEELKDKKIVAIGEQTHKDGSSFEARNRLIQFLISEMGYEAILFEAGMFDVGYGAKRYKESNDILKLRYGLWAFWSVTKQNQSLFPFLKNQIDKGSDLDFDGFDCKITSYAYPQKYLKYLDTLVQNTDSQILTNSIYTNYQKIWTKIINGKGTRAELPKLSKKEINALNLGSELVVKTLAAKYPFYSQMVKMNDKGILIYANKSILSLLFNKKLVHKLNNERDILMADNLNYLLENKYKDKKVILFGATYHFIKNNNQIVRVGKFPIPIETSIVMGDLLQNKYQKDIYTIGFTANKGAFGNSMKPKKIKPASANSIEKYLLDNGKKDGLLILKDYDQNDDLVNKNITMRLFSYSSSVASKDWSKVLDAVFFIDEMKPIQWLKASEIK